MMYFLYQQFYSPEKWYSFIRVFQYITFRTAYAAVTGLILSWGLAWWFIPRFKKWEMALAESRSHLEFQEGKTGTPTMGGIFIVVAIAISTLLWADLSNQLVLILMFVLLSLGALGLLDDWLKLRLEDGDGFSVRTKIIGQLLIVGIVAVWLANVEMPIRLLWQSEKFRPELGTALFLPFLKATWISLGVFYVPFVMTVILGSTNAVNLTDGLDGLAVGTVIFVAVAYGGMTYISGHFMFSEYLQVPNLKGSGEMTVFIASLIGACLGFLWFNAHPAQIFMGDAGALPLGGSLGTVAVIIKQELLLFVVGGIFVVEALSVMIQVGLYRLTGERFFKMAPLHHHFELDGMEESKITVRFWIIGIILALVALSTLKLR